jgi:hypothetical protein
MLYVNKILWCHSMNSLPKSVKENQSLMLFENVIADVKITDHL